jgi:peptide-methionine (S)-S-oxide reductase
MNLAPTWRRLRKPLQWSALATALLGASIAHAEQAVVIPAPLQDETPGKTVHSETAVFAGGCFWGVQGVFQHVNGVTQAVSGYAGGQAQTAHYEEVGSGETGHAESVQVTYDPTQITYGQLLQIYFSVVHDPTELNRQGPDSGTQYRSAIFVSDAGQRQIAQAYITQLNGAKAWSKPLATTVEDLKGFYAAEGYHQDYLTQHPYSPYIMINDQPKVAALEATFKDRYRDKPVLVNP